MRRWRWFSLMFLLCGLVSHPMAQDSYAIRNAKVVTVSGQTIDRGTVLIRDGLIAEVGVQVSIPSGTRVISGRGLTVYPGLFDANTRLGLTEVGAVAVTNDYSEMGDYTPHLLSFSAFHVESEHLAVARVEGITHALTVPTGGVIPGQAALMHLAGWSPQEMEVDRNAALILNLPSLLPMRRRFGRAGRRTHSERKKEFDQKIAELKDLFAKARHYAQAREAGIDVVFDKQLQALLPALRGQQPVLILANSHADIKEAVRFGQEAKLDFVLVGGRDAWMVADFLKENQVRVILGPIQTLPAREDDPIDIVYRTPALLHEKGVRFGLATGSSSDVRTLAFEIGTAVAYGLPWEAAIRAITLTPASFLKADDRLGSIEKGKIANLVVADGDILEYQTKIHQVFVKGKPISLESKHTQLFKKYLNRP